MEKRILITSAGRRVQLIDCFKESASSLGLDLKVYTCDINPKMSSACHHSDKTLPIAPCLTEEYIPTLLQISQQEAIDAIIPTIDPELETLAQNAPYFNKTGTSVVISSPETIDICRNKIKTAEFLRKHGLITPKTSLLNNIGQIKDWQFPLIIKPINGSSSVGIQIIRTTNELEQVNHIKENYMIQECWEGDEYTVNMFFSNNGKLTCTIPHLRAETRGGEVSKGITKRIPQLEEAATILAANLPNPYGPLCFQAIVKPSGEYCIFEINARFGGGYPLAHKAGATFTQWILEDLIGMPSSANNLWEQDLIMLRHDTAVFLSHEKSYCL